MKVSPLTAEASLGYIVSGLGAADIAEGAVRDTSRLPWIPNVRSSFC